MGTSVLEQKHLLENPIAEGGQDALQRPGRPVANKIGNASVAAAPLEVERFFDEGSITNDITSPHVLPAEDEGSPLLVIPSIEGPDAEQLGTRTITGSCAPLTPIYTSPEQARGGEPTPRSDLFALGASMLALLSGCLPRRSVHPHATLLEAAGRPLPRLRDLTPDVQQALAEIIDRAAQFHPDDRTPSARAMWNDLARLLAESGSAEAR